MFLSHEAFPIRVRVLCISPWVLELRAQELTFTLDFRFGRVSFLIESRGDYILVEWA